MNKVCIVGCGGSGKSSLARKLGEITGLPILYLDVYFWKAGWVQRNNDKWFKIVSDLVKQDKWIMDGNFERTQDIRFSNAGTIIFLDIPRYKCLFNAVKRVFVHWNKQRPDMADGCYESFDFSFYKWIWRYKKNDGKKTQERIEKLKGQKDIFVYKSYKEINSFIKSIQEKADAVRKS